VTVTSRSPSVGGRRIAVLAAFVLVAVLAFALLDRGSYHVNVRFENAGQLVPGGEVQVAGRAVGKVVDIGLSDNGQANVEISVDDAFAPLRLGTRARIRAVGQAGVANRFIELSPALDAGRRIPDGGVIPTTQTTGIVDLDALFSTFDARTRRDLSALITHSSEVFAGSGSRTFNSMLAKLEPGLADVQGLMTELASDEAAIGAFVRTSAATAQAIASRRDDLSAAVVEGGRAFAAIAQERGALAGVLDRSPSVLRQARGTLRNVARTAVALRPALRDAPRAARALTPLLRELTPALERSAPVVRSLARQLPDLRASLAGFAPLAGPASRAFAATARAAAGARPMLRGLRFYGPDFLLGVTNGLAGLLSANYNSSGHYARLSFVQNAQTTLAGVPAALLSQQALAPGLLGSRFGLTAPCPGHGAPPAADGSNPYVPDPSLCDPSQSVPASVNEP
jgi:phospholipid/cholesterol/gamma-HCH transport system substrate-binding protein